MFTNDLTHTHIEVDHDAQELSDALAEPSEADDLASRLERLAQDLERHFAAQDTLVRAASERLGVPLEEAAELGEHRDRLFGAIRAIRARLAEGNGEDTIAAAVAALQTFLLEFEHCTDTQWRFITQYGGVTMPSLGGGG